MTHCRLSIALAVSATMCSIPNPLDATANSIGRSTAAVSETGSSAGALPWPVRHPRVIRGARIPEEPWAPGHRGVDVAARPGDQVSSPVSGWVRFAGTVVDRPVLSIEQTDGLIITLEPVESAVQIGQTVDRGSVVGSVSRGGHCASACLHIGVIRSGRYLSPLRVFTPIWARLKPVH